MEIRRVPWAREKPSRVPKFCHCLAFPVLEGGGVYVSAANSVDDAMPGWGCGWGDLRVRAEAAQLQGPLLVRRCSPIRSWVDGGGRRRFESPAAQVVSPPSFSISSLEYADLLCCR